MIFEMYKRDLSRAGNVTLQTRCPLWSTVRLSLL